MARVYKTHKNRYKNTATATSQKVDKIDPNGKHINMQRRWDDTSTTQCLR